MKLFSYAMVYAFIVFLIYLFVKFIRFAFVRIKAYIIRRKLSKVADSEKKRYTEKKDG
jgi:hypothetical protein